MKTNKQRRGEPNLFVLKSTSRKGDTKITVSLPFGLIGFVSFEPLENAQRLSAFMIKVGIAVDIGGQKMISDQTFLGETNFMRISFLSIFEATQCVFWTILDLSLGPFLLSDTSQSFTLSSWNPERKVKA